MIEKSVKPTLNVLCCPRCDGDALTKTFPIDRLIDPLLPSSKGDLRCSPSQNVKLSNAVCSPPNAASAAFLEENWRRAGIRFSSGFGKS